MTAQQLKNSILQMAVQGKLVPQDPTDEPASVLLERIRAEKEKLIKEGKIKKEKNPSVIFRGSDNLPYEKVGKEVRCIADEIPFEIPDSWEWIRLGNIGEWGAGSTPSRTQPEYYKNGTIPWLKTGDLTDGYIAEIPESISQIALKKTSVKLNPAGSVLIAMYGATIGKLGILTFPATTNQACCACLPLNGVENLFLFYFLMAMKTFFVKQSEGGAQPNISKEKIVATLMPLPPFAEQKRIVAKIEELLPHIEEYGKAESKVSKLNAEFPEQLKKSILQWAIQGKLVPQNPEDEPASVLLERIRAEKAKLIKEGKIKKDKNESVIFRRDNLPYEKVGKEVRCIADEIPFEIPDSWEWIRLGNIGEWGAGSTPSRTQPEYYKNGTIPWLKTGDLTDGYIAEIPESISQIALKKTSVKLNPAGSVLIAMYGATIGKLGILTFPATTNQACCACLPLNGVENLFLFYFLMAMKTFFVKQSEGGAQPNISKEKIVATLMPLPPFAEQKRIVAEIEKIFKIQTAMRSK